jgi:hypothetical protein
MMTILIILLLCATLTYLFKKDNERSKEIASWTALTNNIEIAQNTESESFDCGVHIKGGLTVKIPFSILEEFIEANQNIIESRKIPGLNQRLRRTEVTR